MLEYIFTTIAMWLIQYRHLAIKSANLFVAATMTRNIDHRNAF